MNVTPATVNVTPATMNAKQTTWKERISYGLADTASNLVFQVITTYLLFFYTDVAGLSAAAVGTLFLIARVIDAFDSPIIGIMIDKTSTRWGKARPWFLWLAVPFSAMAILTFYVPDLSASGKLAYAYVTYIILGIIYAGINLPITAMLPSMSSNSQERTVIGVVRMVLALVGSMFVAVFTLPIVDAIGGGDQQKGFFWTMVIFSIAAALLFVNAFWNTREHIRSSSSDKALPVKVAISAIKGNWPWVIVLFLNFIFWVASIMKTQTTVYFFTYNMGNKDLIPAAQGASILMFVTLLMVPFFTKKIGKRNTMILGLAISIVGQLVQFAGSSSASVPVIFAGIVIAALGMGFCAGLLFTMIADTVDYGEWKNNVRAQGLLTSASSFGVKFGMGLGGAVCAWILSFGGYQANKEQTSSALFAIELNFIWIPLICFALAIVALLFYKLDKEEAQMLAELESRRVTE